MNSVSSERSRVCAGGDAEREESIGSENWWCQLTQRRRGSAPSRTALALPQQELMGASDCSACSDAHGARHSQSAA